MQRGEEIFAQLDAYCRAEGFAGWDPFDGLNSRLLRYSGLGASAWVRLAWLQLFKRSPVNLRALSFTSKSVNAKALALFMRSYMLRDDRDEVLRLFTMLMALRKDEADWGKAAWGYPFDWQARAFFVPKEAPNVICTAYAVRALEALQRYDGQWIDDGYFAAASEFVATHLLCEAGGQRFIGYVPGADTLVYNANLWGAYVCLKAHEVNGDERLKTLAEEAIDCALRAQRDDGAWEYGTSGHHRFVDGFHSGYNLEALHLMNATLQREDVARAIDKGLDYYVRQCFEAGGLARYYDTNPYPIDPHSSAQGVLTLLQIAPDQYGGQIDAIMDYALDNLWNERGYFNYQRHRGYTNRIAYMRWTQAWMHLALSAYAAWKKSRAM